MHVYIIIIYTCTKMTRGESVGSRDRNRVAGGVWSFGAKSVWRWYEIRNPKYDNFLHRSINMRLFNICIQHVQDASPLRFDAITVHNYFYNKCFWNTILRDTTTEIRYSHTTKTDSNSVFLNSEQRIKK